VRSTGSRLVSSKGMFKECTGAPALVASAILFFET
jgi:hypothetical protein